IVLLSSGATIFAMRRTSTTFDEVLRMAGGARGYHTGHFDLDPEHAPLLAYLYGLPVFLSHPHFPPEPAQGKRYNYAATFFFRSGNDPERLAFRGRLVGVAFSVALIALIFAFARRRFGEAAAILAAFLVAFLPDVLAHGGVAYDDLPTAPCWFGAVWAL